MKITTKTLKKYYDLFKQWSTDENYKKDVTILGHKVTLVYTVDLKVDLSIYCEIFEVQMDRVTRKFFDKCENIFGRDLHCSDYISDLVYLIQQSLENKLSNLYKNLPYYNQRKELYKFFFDDSDTLRSFDEVKHLYKNRDIVTPKVQVPISSSYTAVIEKGRNIQVGCQSIPIETVKKIVAAYEKING